MDTCISALSDDVTMAEGSETDSDEVEDDSSSLLGGDEELMLTGDHSSGYLMVAPIKSPTAYIPFPLLPWTWYREQGRLESANVGRKEIYDSGESKLVDGNLKYIMRAKVTGSLKDNIRSISSQLQVSKANGQTNMVEHLQALLECANLFAEQGPLLSTQEVGKRFYQVKHQCEPSRPLLAAAIYDTLSKHLNLVQVYISGKAYLMEDIGGSVMYVLNTIAESVNKQEIVRKHIEDKLANIYPIAIQYLDTPRDREVLRGITVKLTSNKFAAKLECKKSRHATRNAGNMLETRLSQYQNIRQTSQVVRNDMTCKQQHLFTQRMISARKLKEIRIIAAGRGRHLKADEFPELGAVLQYAFGERDIRENSGGGLESHPRLIDGVLYRSCDNATNMKLAREVLLSMAPENFSISLSACYSYTENYRVGSAQAKRHHSHRPGVNANISLKLPPRTGVLQQVVNLHWSTANVNLLVDGADISGNVVTISKDAKTVIPTNGAPVQRQGRTWSKRMELPDHTFDQSRLNTITPMTFLFLQTKVSQHPVNASALTELQMPLTDECILKITRSGQVVTLLYLSFFEGDSTFRCMN